MSRPDQWAIRALIFIVLEYLLLQILRISEIESPLRIVHEVIHKVSDRSGTQPVPGSRSQVPEVRDRRLLHREGQPPDLLPGARELAGLDGADADSELGEQDVPNA